MSYENENRDCIRCGNPLAGDNSGDICFQCKRILAHPDFAVSRPPTAPDAEPNGGARSAKTPAKRKDRR